MVITCCVDGCPEKYCKGCTTTFHCFPKDPIKRRLWLIAIKKEDFELKESTPRVCSNHFTIKDYNRKKLGGSWLKPNAVPKLFNFSTKNSRSLLFPLEVNISDDETSSSSSSNLSSSSSSLFSEREDASIEESTSSTSFKSLLTPIEQNSSAEEAYKAGTSSRSSKKTSLSRLAKRSERDASIEESTSSTSFQSLLIPIENNSSTEELYKAGTSRKTRLSKKTSLFRLAKKCAPEKVEIEDSSLAKRVKENDPKHVRYLEYISNIKGMDKDVSLASSIRWDVAKRKMDLKKRQEAALKEKNRLKKHLKSVRGKIDYLRKLNSYYKTRLDESTN